MLIGPAPAPQARQRHASRRYDWSKVQIGQWQNWISPEPSEPVITDAEAHRRYMNLRNSAREWALRRGLRVQTRRRDGGRILDLRFVPADSPEVS
jgi:hypothetical protein